MLADINPLDDKAACPGIPPGPGAWAMALRRLILMVLLLCVAAGCVTRRLIVRSDPPGALVYVDNYEVGRTPVGVNFLYYGVRQVRLVLDGHETLTEYVWLRPPWYEVAPAEFVAENFVPLDIQDRREVFYKLRPRAEAATGPLIQRGEQLRGMATGTVPPPPQSVERPRDEAPPEDIPAPSR